jgi:hypothetical protein
MLRRGKPLKGYRVSTSAAVDILEKTDLEAARWWRTNAPHLFTPGRFLVFEEQDCAVEDSAIL